MNKVFLIIWTLVVLALAGFVAATQAWAADCTPLAEIRAKAVNSNARVAYIDDTRTTQAMNAFYNAQPPESTETFSAAYIVTLPGGMSQVLLGSGDQICGGFNLPTEVLNQLMRRLMGAEL